MPNDGNTRPCSCGGKPTCLHCLGTGLQRWWHGSWRDPGYAKSIRKRHRKTAPYRDPGTINPGGELNCLMAEPNSPRCQHKEN